MVKTAADKNPVKGILPFKNDKMKPITIKSFSLMNEATQQIQDLALHKEVVKDSHDSNVVNVDEMEITTTNLESSGKQNAVWLQYGCYILTKQHKIILYNGDLLDDIHIGAAQYMIGSQFPLIGGLQNTVLLVSSRVKQIKSLTGPSMQILHCTCGRYCRSLDCVIYHRLCRS